MRYDLNDLRLIINIDASPNLTRAAEKSYLSLPAASGRLKNFEDALGTPLLVRSSRHMSLTPAGQIVLRHARQVFDALEQMHVDLEAFSSGVKGCVRIRANASARSSALFSLLAQFLAANPDVDVDLEELESSSVAAAVASGAAHIGIVNPDVRVEGLDAFDIGTDELVCIVPHSASGEMLSIASLSHLVDSYPFIGLRNAVPLHMFLAGKVRSLGKRFRFRVEVDSYEAMCKLVAAGVGAAIVPRSLALSDPHIEELQLVQLEETWARRRRRILTRPRQTLPPYVCALLDYLLSSHASIANPEQAALAQD